MDNRFLISMIISLQVIIICGLAWIFVWISWVQSATLSTAPFPSKTYTEDNGTLITGLIHRYPQEKVTYLSIFSSDPFY